ncbi:Putative membrane peptidase family [Ruminococcus sp. YE71]|uniref:YhfC family glutamic-type intramembrane protease n=1 Tax=unclassified Ruminococcus TaxID=2608920 RepID=UPI00088C0E8F|nr:MULTISPECIES: YhfC family glutamic-type intramembrane protease [unclassified Ruminococcus]SDA16032.1 Putative membrane peptidase family [Ruminococcus sp. YE78]SFW23773.1 Putative membrane peptidase family [Ruminococcus sp. YE71]
MKDLSCLLAGLIWLAEPTVLLYLWRRKTGALIYPAFIAFGVCIPVFMFAAAVRLGFEGEVSLGYFIKRGLLYGVLEEGAKFLALKFLSDRFGSRRDAVSYSIGHGAFEGLTAGLTCLGLIGTGRAAGDILPVNIWSAAEGAASCAALTIVIWYGIAAGRSRLTLPSVMLMHAVSNMAGHILQYTVWGIPVRTLLTAGECAAAVWCWKRLAPDEDG